MRSARRTCHFAARGAVLLLCLLLLLALSLLGLAAAADQHTQDRINGNIHASREDQQVARLGSLWARDWLLGQAGDSAPAPCSEPCPAGSVIRASGSIAGQPEYKDAAWWRTHAYPAGIDPTDGAEHEVPGLPIGAEAHWLIEQVRAETMTDDGGSEADQRWYRVLVRGASGLPGSGFVSETIIARPWGESGWRDSFPSMPDEETFCAHAPQLLTCGRVAWQDLP